MKKIRTTKITKNTKKNMRTTKITKNTKEQDAGLANPLVLVIFVVFVVLCYFAYAWWFSDERAIKHQLSTIAGALTVRPNEGDLGPVTRLAVLRKTLAPDIRVSAGAQDVVSREAVLALASRWTAPPGGVTVEFADVQVKVGADRAGAEAYCTAKITTRDTPAGAPTVDARELTIGFARQEGEWLVSSVRTEETLAR